MTDQLFPGPYDPERLREAFTESCRRFWEREGFSMRVAHEQPRPRLRLVTDDLTDEEFDAMVKRGGER